MKSLVLFDSLGGNTEHIARTIFDTLAGVLPSPQIVKIVQDSDLDFFDYDIVFIGSPVIDWLPTKTMMDFVRKKLKAYNKSGLIKPAAPIIPGKFGVCFCTFAGPHIGKREALPMTMWLRSALEHLGFIVLDTWHIVGQFNTMKKLNRRGRLGNIENRPDDHDFTDLRNKVLGVIAALEAWQR
jgi:hypothetical protein